MASIAQAQLFRPFTDHKRPPCSKATGNPAAKPMGSTRERVYDGKWAGLPPFELHMGPYHEFALYRGIQDEHRDHKSAENLLEAAHVEIRANAARQSWDVDGLHLEVALAGGSREDCESWYVTLKRSPTTPVAVSPLRRLGGCQVRSEPDSLHNPAEERYCTALVGRARILRHGLPAKWQKTSIFRPFLVESSGGVGYT